MKLDSRHIPFILCLVLFIICRDSLTLTRNTYAFLGRAWRDIQPIVIASYGITKATFARLCELGGAKLTSIYIEVDLESTRFSTCLDAIASVLLPDIGRGLLAVSSWLLAKEIVSMEAYRKAFE